MISPVAVLYTYPLSSASLAARAATAAETTNEAKEKPRLFLSYGRKDAKGLADRLHDDLEAAGYDVWRDTEKLRGGNDWQQKIVDGLRSTQLVLAVLSPHAVRVAADQQTVVPHPVWAAMRE